MNVIKDIEIDSEEGVVCYLGQTTHDLAVKALLDFPPAKALSFISVNFPPEFKLLNKEYGRLKQLEQYSVIKQLLQSYKTTLLQKAVIIFEQCRSGQIHFHIVVQCNPDVHVHDFKIELFNLFSVTNLRKYKNLIDVRPVNDLAKLILYLTDKNKKGYEHVDQTIFKPFILKDINMIPSACAVSILEETVKAPENQTLKKNKKDKNSKCLWMSL